MKKIFIGMLIALSSFGIFSTSEACCGNYGSYYDGYCDGYGGGYCHR